MAKRIFRLFFSFFALQVLFSYTSVFALNPWESNFLQAHYEFNANLNDSSIWGRYLVQSVGSSSNYSYVSDRNGNSSSALFCDGSAGFITDAGFSLPSTSTTTGRTISFWSSGSNIFGTVGHGDRNFIGVDFNAFSSHDSNTTLWYINTSAPITYGTLNMVSRPTTGRHNYIITSNSSSTVVYIDGVYNNSTSSVTPWNGGVFNICRTRSFNGAPNFKYFNGIIDEIAYFDKYYTGSDITDIYSGAPPPPAPSGTCGTSLTSLCPASGDRVSLYEYIENENIHYRTCGDPDLGLENATYCSLTGSGLPSTCGTLNKTFIGTGVIPSVVSGGNNFCSPSNFYLSGPYSYSSIDKQYFWFCINPTSGTVLSRCDAKSQEYTQPSCGPWAGTVISTGNFSFSTDSSNLCSYGTVSLTGTRYGLYNNLSGNSTSGIVEWYWYCGISSIEGNVVECTTQTRDGPLDPDSLLYGINRENTDKNSITSVTAEFRKYFNKFGRMLGLEDFFTKFPPSFVPDEQSFDIQIPKPNFSNGSFNRDFDNVATIDSTDLKHYFTRTCSGTGGICITTVGGNTITSTKSYFSSILPVLFAFVHITLSLGLLVVILFYPSVRLFGFLKEPLLFLSVRHIDDSTNTVLGKLLTFSSYVMMGAVLAGIITLLFGFASGIVQVFVAVSYTMFSFLTFLFGGSIDSFITSVSAITAIAYTVLIILFVRFVAKFSPL